MKTISSSSRKVLEKKAVSIIKSKILSTLKSKPQVILGIPGGRSVKNIFSLLSISDLPWNKIHFFLVDERKVPLSSPESNYNLAHNYFKSNLHPYNYKLSASSYTKQFLTKTKVFDLILLSSGEDSHIASLFPNHPSIKDKSKYYIPISNSPKPPSNRISISSQLLTKSKTAVLLFFGKNKAQAYLNFKNPKLSINRCPSKLIYKIKDSYVLTDLN